jgi:hypothetical protein
MQKEKGDVCMTDDDAKGDESVVWASCGEMWGIYMYIYNSLLVRGQGLESQLQL